MNRRWLSFSVLLAAVLVGCGGIEAPSEPESLANVSQSLVTCSANCSYGTPTSLSCQGTTCSAQENSHVTCDGNTQYCEAPPYCELFNRCDLVNGMSCSQNRATRDCCFDNPYAEGTCFCAQGSWVCPF